MPLIIRDRKKKKFIQPGDDGPKMKKMRTESGNWINASYKSGMYEKWQKKAKINPNVTTDNDDDDDGGDDGDDKQKRNRSFKMPSRKKPKQSNGDKRGPKRELKTKDEIFKQRKRLERIQTHQKKRQRQRVVGHNKGKATKRKGKR